VKWLMRRQRKYLVPVDFTSNTDLALAYALNLAREDNAKLLLVYVVAEVARGVPLYLRDHYHKDLQARAKAKMQRLLEKHRLDAKRHRVVYFRARDPAKAIVAQAKKSRVSMIIMGSRGLKGLKRLLLGSVAEKTLRYARCPVLVVKG